MAKSKRRHFKSRPPQMGWKGIVAIILAIVLLGFLVFQAILGLKGEINFKGENYFGQPIDPALQIVMVVVFVVIMILALIRYLKYKSKPNDEKKSRPPRNHVEDIPGKVPDRFPWEQ